MAEIEERKSNKVLTTIVILLLITIGVLLWLLLRPTPEPEAIRTGNVDVFDIRIGRICKKEDGTYCDDEDEIDYVPYPAPSGKNRKNSYGEKEINGKTDTDIDKEGIIYADDKNGWFIYQKHLRIFENAAFEYTTKIAPGVSNSYDFKVHNETKNAISYNIEFEEESEYPIYMRYRLKREGKYIVGSDTEWVDASELVSALKLLPTDSVDSYTLDWKWPYESGRDALDTKIGEEMVSEYSLGIKINFEEV